MSLCTPCKSAKEINICTDELVIGTVTPNTDYNIWFKCLANGFIVKYVATSDNAGVLALDTSEGLILATNLMYELYVNTTNSINTGETITIGLTQLDCINVVFVNAGFKSDSQTIEL